MSINLAEVGAFASAAAGGFHVRFGLYLPGVRASDGFDVVVRIIHSADRFDPTIQPQDTPLAWNAGHPLDLWTATVPIPTVAGSHFGGEGTYLYRFQLWWTPPGGARRLVTRWFTDPFARETDIGELSAVRLSQTQAQFAWTDSTYETPELADLIVYELHIGQFNDAFAGVAERLVYLQSLGVNCLELMPVTSPKHDFDWGYGPLHYFAPSEHFGGPDALRSLIDQCHAANIAVILDVVYQHVDPDFAYKRVYADIAGTPGAPRIQSPMIGVDGPFGPQIDFSRTFAQDYVATANRHWLDEYHVDGFRYDEVTDLYSGPTDTAYAKLAYDTYRYSLALPRFVPDPVGYSRLIQCTEALGRAPDVLRNTYTNCAWQDDLLGGAEAIAGGATPTDGFAHTLDPSFADRYPSVKTVVNAAGAAVDMPVTPFQYLNSHDHSHLIVFAGTTGSGAFPPGDRSQVWRLQPLAIALMTSQGVPMLWEGEELCDDYHLPSDGSARINLRRDMHWEYFYDDFGAPLVRLYRRLGQLRRSARALRGGESFYYWNQSLQGTELVAYHRRAPADAGSPEQYAMVALNFSSSNGSIQLPFPKAGIWTEQLDADVRPAPWTLEVAAPGELKTVNVPSNYGCIFLL